jgi:hypothetical protein
MQLVLFLLTREALATTMEKAYEFGIAFVTQIIYEHLDCEHDYQNQAK